MLRFLPNPLALPSDGLHFHLIVPYLASAALPVSLKKNNNWLYPQHMEVPGPGT